MTWLWLISVGVTDLQFPVWKQDEAGQWTGPWFFESGRAGIRRPHAHILALLEKGLIAFPAIPRRLQGDARELRLELELIDSSFMAEVRHQKSPDYYRISQYGNEIPNRQEPKLPLYCPKVEPLIEVARKQFGDEPVTIVALNTKRNEKFWDALREPIASGPVVARFCAERLGLKLEDNHGQIPAAFKPGTSTWVDLLTEDELQEDRTSQQNVAKRLTRIVQLWTNGGADSKVIVTPSGGIPPLKPLIERIPATYLGQEKVQLLDEPEPGPPPRKPPTVTPVDYHARVAEGETLRFYCAEALRNGDYVGAYGLATRLATSWGRKTRNQLGLLLELPGKTIKIGPHPLWPFQLKACQTEASLCMRDVAGALRYLGTFLEQAIWHLIANNKRINSYGLRCNRDKQCLEGSWPDDPDADYLLERDGRGPNNHPVRGLTRRWPKWLAQQAAGPGWASAQVLMELVADYNGEPREYRNRLMHSSDRRVDLTDIERCLRASQLISAIGAPFGQNFFATPRVSAFLEHTGSSGLAPEIARQLDGLLNDVIGAADV